MELETQKNKKVNATDFARSYYDFQRETEFNGKKQKYYKCKLCNKEINGTKPSNLVPHLRQVHSSILEKFEKNKNFATQRLMLMQYLVEIVTVNGRSFTHLLDTGFEGVLSFQMNDLKKAGFGINLQNNHCEVVKILLSEMAVKIRDKIKIEVNRRALSLLIDAATRNRRSFLGISVQYKYNGKLRVRSVGMIQLENHTQQHISVMLLLNACKIITSICIKYLQ